MGARLRGIRLLKSRIARIEWNFEKREQRPADRVDIPAMNAHIYGHMKTTIEIDEVKLDRIMKLTGITTMKEAVDWALHEALRLATIHRVMEDPWTPEEAREAVDPAYDLIAIRNGSSPLSYSAVKSGKRGRSRKTPE